MFTFLFLAFLLLGAYFLFDGLGNKKASRIVSGISIIVFSALFFWFMDFWGEKLWFGAVGYKERFWDLFLFEALSAVGGGLLALVLSSLFLLPLGNSGRFLRYAGYGFAAFIGGVWGFGNWSVFMKYWYGVKTSLADPILSRDTGFYLFDLPFYDQLYGLLLIISILTLVASFFSRYRLVGEGNNYELKVSRKIDEGKVNRSIYLNAGILLIVLAAGKYLDRFHLLYSQLGAVAGPGWTDTQIILPALTGVAIFTALIGLLLLLPAGRALFQRSANKFVDAGISPAYTLGAAGLLIALVWVVGLNVIPGTFQSFRVEPNEISYEKPYIENNIEFTRHGFNLHRVEDREFPVEESFTQQMVSANQTIFNNIRLWDWRALDAVLEQFQEIRLYYEFNDVDIDRYTFDGQYRQVMISAREMKASNLPKESQTFVNRVFKYTHGYGLALTTVTDFSQEGLPNLLVKNIPPESQYKELEVEQPQIYYGELTDQYVITNSGEEEFDYPRGDENEYISYPGKGGVQLSNFWRKFIYSYKMGDVKLLLSSYLTPESRLMYRRQIVERVKTLAPFLIFDRDPYIVNADGKLYWMIDAYTASEYFPYSEPFSSREVIQYKEGERERNLRVRHDPAFEGMNYIRNSVKVVVDAFNGNVDFYTFDDEDPLIQVWDKIFPGLLKSKGDMPDALMQHIRYPATYLLIQGLVYAKYHMNDPEVFYNQEDLWIRATEKYYGEVQPVEPYYIMWQQPEAEQAEFSVILPFTPKNRQVSIGWIAGLCDPQNYGRFLAYSFPKEKRILGPQQVETKIDQNSFLSGQLSLWDQRGSRVIRGNVLAIPVENTIIYVEPIYLQAETAAYPELRLVCVMHDDKLSYAETFEEALTGLLQETSPAAALEGEAVPLTDRSMRQMIDQANEAFNNYIQATGESNFDRAAGALQELKSALQQLSDRDTTRFDQ
ncbi:MAG: UPF0182 family protein [Saprospiraceae bacterium]|nr:UPF0182 family protein [Saprospiraceae bacterium]